MSSRGARILGKVEDGCGDGLCKTEFGCKHLRRHQEHRAAPWPLPAEACASEAARLTLEIDQINDAL